MTLTRYLYDRSHVEHSLFMSLLNRDSEQAKFWTYELYHSGFKRETFILLWKYYYQLYAGFYVNLERFILRMTNDWLNNPKNDTLIGNIVENMAYRETCIEFYRIINGELRAPSQMEDYINDIRSAKTINECYEIIEKFIRTYNCFKNKGRMVYKRTRDSFDKISLLDNKYLDILKYACISRMFTGMFLLEPENGFDDRMNIILNDTNISKYKNRPFIQCKAWKILRKSCIYKLEIKPDYKDENTYNYDDDKWLLYASSSPIWKNRIEKYGGKITNDCIIFEDTDKEEAFYDWFNVEPDEQPKHIKEMWIGCSTYNNWDEIYNKYACEPFNEWLQSFCM